LNSTPSPGFGIHLGDWVEPDVADLRVKMKYVVENYNEVSRKTLQSAKIIQETHSWDVIAEKVLDHLGDKVYRTV
jgi:glycosyltransferase involved in cell wall biosynthesis